MRENPVKKRLGSGETLLGTWLSIGDGLGAELMACVGWDWLLIDMEHGPIPLSNAASMVIAVRAGGVTPFVRPAWNESSQIQRVLDLGAYGIVVPMINTADQARAVVRDARFPPLGERSRGGVRANLAFDTDGNTYLDRANDEVLVYAQVETDEAVANAPEILAVDGIDGIFIGPNDLAVSSGKRWPEVWGKDEEYMTAIASIPRICGVAGKTAGILARDPEMAAELVAMGYRFVGIASDVVFLISAASAALQHARDEIRAARA
jgi:4-hydroxy-2-oxoheptanedioate aldolase